MSLWSLIQSSQNQLFSYSITTVSLITILLSSSSVSSTYQIHQFYQDCFCCLSGRHLLEDDNNNIGWHHCVSLIIFIIDIIPLLILICLIYPVSLTTLHCKPLTVISWVSNLAKSLTDIQTDSSTSALSVSQDLLYLSDCCVLAVYQLKQFKSINHVYVSLISNDVVSLVHRIVILYFTSSGYQPVESFKACQTHVNISQPDLRYSTSWSLTRSSFIKAIHWFKDDSTPLLNHPAFLTWTSFQSFSINPKQSDSFKTGWRLCWFIASILNEFNLFMMSSSVKTDPPHKSTSLKTCSWTSISVESISHSSLLSYNMINNKNDSQHSNHKISVNSVFSEIQMQMLWDMIVQTKKDSCAEDHVKAVNSASQHPDAANLFCCSEQSVWYSDKQNIHQQCWYNSDSDNPDPNNPDKSVSDISDVSWRHCNNDNTQFCSEKVGFFNLHLDVKNYGIDNIIDINNKIYFQDVHLFIDSFKNIVHIKIEKVVHCNLNKCLWDIAQDWYISQLSVIERKYIWKEQSMKHWEEMLFWWFKCTQLNAMKMLEMKQYIIQNVQNNQELSDFILNIICHAKNVNMINTSAQLM